MKPDLVILHGALGCKEQFTAWAEALAETFTCHLLDFSGHGTKSDSEKNFSIELFSNDLLNYIAEKKLSAPHVLGYSMGGYVALHTALQRPASLGNILTLATKFNWDPATSKKEAGYLDPAVIQQKVPQLAEQLRQRHAGNWQKVARKTAEMMLNLGERPRITSENIVAIKNRIKFCVGDKDKMVSLEETVQMFRITKNSNLCVLPSTGHLPETMSVKRIVFEAQDISASASA